MVGRGATTVVMRAKCQDKYCSSASVIPSAGSLRLQHLFTTAFTLSNDVANGAAGMELIPVPPTFFFCLPARSLVLIYSPLPVNRKVAGFTPFPLPVVTSQPTSLIFIDTSECDGTSDFPDIPTVWSSQPCSSCRRAFPLLIPWVMYHHGFCKMPVACLMNSGQLLGRGCTSWSKLGMHRAENCLLVIDITIPNL